MKLPELAKPALTPKGKRRVKQNVYGNWRGYVGSKMFKEFGCGYHGEHDATSWLNEGAETMNIENYVADSVGPAGDNCKEFHTVDSKLFGTKAALKDAVYCGVKVECIHCHMTTRDIPKGQTSIYGKPPEWFMKIAVNMSSEQVVLEQRGAKAQST